MDTRPLSGHPIVDEAEIPPNERQYFRKLTVLEFNELRDKSAEERAAWLKAQRVRDILAKPLAERTTIDRLLLAQAGVPNAAQ